MRTFYGKFGHSSLLRANRKLSSLRQRWPRRYPPLQSSKNAKND
ncbi:MAG TPA: hypothetical protein VHD90_12630 [Phototrophicaceae bacterium]|nr:hypothetical protein [Phototrophicaceae bacterium]